MSPPAIHGWPALQLIAPVEGATVATVRPVFRWRPVALALVQVCADPVCASVVEQFVALGRSGVTRRCLGEGDYAWRATRLLPLPGLRWSRIEPFTVDLSLGVSDGFRRPVGGGLLVPEPGQWQAVTLLDGRVLALDEAGTPELFDPACETFGSTGAMQVARRLYRATRLQDGRVLITGGLAVGGSSLDVLAASEIYDPASGTFSLGPDLIEARHNHTATLLLDGRVLVTGGYGPADSPLGPTVQLDSAEVYDPGTGSFHPVGAMTVTHADHAAVLLASGEVLVAGGLHPASVGGGARNEAALFDPATGSFTATNPLIVQRSGFPMTLLLDGTVLIAGGQSSGALMRPIERFDPATETFAIVGELPDGRAGHTATRLIDGRVLLAAGQIQPDFGAHLVTGTADLYDPVTGTMTATAGPMEAPRIGHGAALLDTGRVVLMGGTAASVEPTAELFVPAAGP